MKTGEEVWLETALAYVTAATPSHAVMPEDIASGAVRCADVVKLSYEVRFGQAKVEPAPFHYSISGIPQ
jgi:hypothetical protein